MSISKNTPLVLQAVKHLGKAKKNDDTEMVTALLYALLEMHIWAEGVEKEIKVANQNADYYFKEMKKIEVNK